MHEFEYPSQESGVRPYEIRRGIEQWENESGQKGYTFLAYQKTIDGEDVYQTVDMYMDTHSQVYVFIMSTPVDATRKPDYINIRRSFNINVPSDEMHVPW